MLHSILVGQWEYNRRRVSSLQSQPLHAVVSATLTWMNDRQWDRRGESVNHGRMSFCNATFGPPEVLGTLTTWRSGCGSELVILP